MITIIDTGVGNFKSIQNMLSRIGVKSTISNDCHDVLHAEKLILPGIGAFDRGMEELTKNNLVEAIKHKALEGKTKILGICLGMQMLGESSEEGVMQGLGLIKGQCKKFSFLDSSVRRSVPHMGWNYVVSQDESMLFQGFEMPPRFYFTHSYYFDCCDEKHILGVTPYGIEFAAAIQKNSIYGVQFHPEKSHRFGMQFLRNFVLC